MKLTKKQEKEVWQVYDTWLHSYINGDVATYNEYLDRDYHFIGSTHNEEFLNKKDTTNFFEATADQLAGKCDLRNENKIIEKFEGLVFVTHLFDAWFKNGNDWAYYGRFRFTNALKENKTGWRFIYQHFSTTDSKTDEGETIGFDKVNAENIELKEAIKRRTIELEQKNRELEVETALERIRAQAVAMKASSDLLDIVVTMRKEFIKLGHEAHYFWHMMWLPKTYEKAMTSGDGSKIGFVMELPRHIHGDIPLLAKWEKSKKPTVVYAMNVDEAIDYVDKMIALGNFKNIDPQAPTHDDIKHIGGLTFIMSRTTHGEIGYSLPGIVKDPPKEDIDILVKFAGAFDLAHQRFLDLQKAEKQARETLIELSLERIRSRVAEMKTSSDLFDIVVTMRNEFMSLGHEADYFWHMKWLEDNYEMSMTAEDGSRLGMVITVPKFVHEQIENLHNWEKSNSPYFVLALNGKDAWDYIENMNTYGQYKQVDPHAPTEEDILHIGGLTFIIARTTHGEIGFSLAGEVPNPPKASIELLLRFAKVFDLAYKRFEDLQKAEAQARETQIELALEKVRSRTMAMQHSDELQETSFLLDQQVRALGIKTWGCAFNIYGEKESTEWFGNEAGVLPPYTVPHKGIFKEYYQKGQKGESLFIQEFSGKACVEHYEYMSTLPVIGDVLKQLKKTNKGFPTFQIDHVVYFKYGYLLFITREPVPESHDVFTRFAKVFEQTYTRFLDLQKAEAQAREAQIEAALERVRSRSMAMHKSEELLEAGALLYSELSKLGIKHLTTGYILFDDNAEIGYSYGVNPADGSIRPKPVGMIHNQTKTMKSIVASWKKQEPLLVIELNEKETIKHQTFIAEKSTNFPLTAAQLLAISPKRLVIHCFNFKQGYLLIVGGNRLLDKQQEMVVRFAKVFQQTYTRFLDLQKAEAQAREALIEAALERVRSRSMAMHKSDELKDVIQVLYDQFIRLNINIEHAGFILDYKKNDDMHIWLADQHAVFPEITLPYFDCAHWNSFNEAKKKGQNFFTNQLGFEEKNKFYKDLFKFIPDVTEDTKTTYFEFEGLAISTVLLDTIGLYIENYSGIPFSDEENAILMRFGKVFQQSYTRFLDLQKAEAQAREAQIEVALERVRAQSNAMHKSDDLAKVVSVVYEELDLLDKKISRCGIGIISDISRSVNVWLTSDVSSGKSIELSGNEPLSGHPLLDHIFDSWKKQENFLYVLEGNDLIDYYKTIEHIDFQKQFAKQGLDNAHIKHYYYCVMFPAGGLFVFETSPITDEKINILQRFSDAFYGAYTRHQDLKKAEAQAREAQIQLALERVRARTMAMQSSEELIETSELLFQQIKELGIELWSCGYSLWYDDDSYFVGYNPMPDGKMGPTFKIPLTEDKFFKTIRKAKREGKEFLVFESKGKSLVKTYEYMDTLPVVGEAMRAIVDSGYELPKYQVTHCGFFTYGHLMFITHKHYPEAHDIFKRFTKEFEQTYTRFLDLQKAEAQAREAQIEAALERVRSRSMAMHNSDEIGDVAFVLFQQLKSLGGEFWGTGFGFCEHNSTVDEFWFANEKGIMPHTKIPNTKDEAHKKMYKGWKNNLDSYSLAKGGKELKDHYKYMLTVPDVQPIFQGMLDNGMAFPKWQKWHAAYFKYGYMLVITTETYENEAIFKRFAKVFEQAYTRFLDLQKAEAQAREAQIEASLERVRSRSMAMQKSSELLEAGELLWNEIIKLGVDCFTSGYVLMDENENIGWNYTPNPSTGKILEQAIGIPHKQTTPMRKIVSSWKKQEPLCVIELTKKQTIAHQTFVAEKGINFPFSAEQLVEISPKEIVLHTFNFKQGYLLIVGDKKISKDQIELMLRFTKVFQQTYTRFLDLQQSEAQARESQIQLALERVRAKTMAMQHSDELREVVLEIYQQLQILDFETQACNIIIIDKETKDMHYWVTGFTQELYPESYHVPNLDHPYMEKQIKAWEDDTTYQVFTWEGKEKRAFDKLFFSETEFKNTPKEAQDMMKSLKSIFLSTAFSSSGLLQVIGQTALNEEMAIILQRFAKVFNQTYTRFLDLQKAEAQAREAQIEAALERVRSQSMGMQTSQDLSNVTSEMFKQLHQFGGDLFATGIVFCDKHEGHVEQWHSLPDAGMMSPFIVPIDLDYIHQYRYDEWKKGTELFSIEIPSDFIEQHFEDIFNLPSAQKVLKDFEDQNTPMPEAPPWEIDYGASFKHGYILVSSLQPFKEAEILPRFAKVFEQTYTRFLDLQKAEAQARETQIEMALEKVRSRTMAMQHSKELPEAANVLFTEVQNLGIPAWSCGYNILSEDKTSSTCIMSSEGEIQSPFVLPLTKHKSLKPWHKAILNNEDFFVYEQGGKDLKEHYDYMQSLPELTETFQQFKQANISLPTFQVNHLAKFTNGFLLFITYEKVPEAHGIFQRFAKVFQQTYTRFLDLQKAEAQAREAKIEMALEKVRSRTMAMQKGEEVKDVVVLLYKELIALGVTNFVSCGYVEVNEKTSRQETWVTSPGGNSLGLFYLPLTGDVTFDDRYKAWKKQQPVFHQTVKGKERKKHLEYAITTFNSKEAEEMVLSQFPDPTVFYCFNFSHGYLHLVCGSYLNKEEESLLARFTRVFEQTYARFLDLERAEEQTRKAQIEASLERVRARAMAMHDSNELDEVLSVLCEQFDVLGIYPMSTHMTVMDLENNSFTFRETGKFGDRSFGEQTVALDAMDNWKETIDKWIADEATAVNKLHFPKEQLPKVWEVFHESFASMPEGSRITPKDYPDGIYHTAGKHPFGYIGMNQIRPATEEEEQIVIKFANEFGRAYQRFLDLKKAEAQTRTAQINLAVERVRAKALAMHKSEEIMEVVAKLKDEVMGLDIPDVVASTIFLNEGENKVRMWDLSSLEHEEHYSEVPFDITFKLKKSDPHLYVKRVWENPKDYFIEIQDDKNFKRLMQWLREQNKKEIADEVENHIEKAQLKRLYHAAKKLNNGKLVIDLLSPPSDEMESILTKMGAAFDLAYKRFEDLQKAEAQAREALIEAALERVRSRSMAMHSSEELLDVIGIISEQIMQLNIAFETIGFGTYNKHNEFKFWLTSPGQKTPKLIQAPYLDNPAPNRVLTAQKKGVKFFTDVLNKKESKQWVEHLIQYSDLKYYPETIKDYVLNAPGFARSSFILNKINLYIGNYQAIPFSDSDNAIFNRFAQVFEQAYTRFLDIQKSETQARESQIEAALEKVRSRSLAMHNADELGEVVLVIVEKLKELGVILDSNGITLCTYFPDSKDVLHWIASPDFSHVGKHLLPYFDHVILKDAWQSKEQGDSYFSKTYSIKEKNSFFEHAFEHSDYKHFPEEFKQWIFKNDKHILSFAWQKNSALLIPSNTGVLPTNEEKNILIRFAKVFEQAYIRFMDLKKSEAQAREAKIEAALEKVRSRTLAMQNSDELAETSVVVFQQLLELGIAPNRLFIGIIKENVHKIEAWATNEDGSKLAKHFTLEASKNKSIKKMLDGWKQKKKSLVIDMKGKELQNYFQYLNEDMDIPFIHGLDQKRRVQTIAYFSGGLIGMAAPEEQPEATIKLLERFAAVFNLTYTRFNDLKVAEAQTKKAEEDLIKLQAAKKSAEEALSELQTTQTQLIQSEKMASLGELTAGIAHEIQNPLNFVNNFSEVSKELLEEMFEEMANGDMEEVKAIMDDVIQNLEKINHHGKRADGIVKGMLQHSRSSTGTKEPTDINVLADEYLRLAYHGLRAKDKSFNANLVTDFNDTIGNINIIPQDIGRVVLNLLTNAFYAVSEKKNQNIVEGYEPTVSITTTKNGNWVAIAVKDNGNGIPQKVLDKIFQPFFTTKPTGQGTGLGLSMSYDIITKGHGGELKVNTKQGEGTEFSIYLPL